MARLASQAKQGFYPAHPSAIEALAKHLKCRPPDPTKKNDKCHALDPCAGKGAAIHSLTTLLGIPEEQVYTVELDAGRTEDIKALMPKANNLGPAGFAGTHITGQSFGLAYVNPPFDTELGGGRREEHTFVDIAAKKLVPKGVMVAVCPLGAISGNRPFVECFDAQFENVSVYKFPDGYDELNNQIRPYNEIVIIGTKRVHPLPRDRMYASGMLHQMQFSWRGGVELRCLPNLGEPYPLWFSGGNASHEREPEIRTWEIPHSWKPAVFKKIAFTEQELEEILAESPLHKILNEVPAMKPARPPMPLDKGHLGLILASGMLDGVVDGPHGSHVVRGSSRKIQYHNKEASSSEMNPDTGAVTTKDVYSERQVTIIRVVEPDGQIYTYSNGETDDATDEKGDANEESR